MMEIHGQVPSLRQRMGLRVRLAMPDGEHVCRRIAPAVEENFPANFVACHFAARQVAG